MRPGPITTMVVFLAMLFGVAAASASTNYVCWRGGFYFSYPDFYRQVDYNLVDSYLQNRGIGRSALNYEVVLADSTADPFFSGEYLILSFTPLDSLGQKQIDSVLAYYRHGFETGIRHAPLATFLENLPRSIPYYDAALKTITFANDIGADSSTMRRGIVIEKMFDKGIATFYFYAPDSLFQKRTVGDIGDIIRSFSTENLEEAAKGEPIKVADLSDVDLTPDEFEKDRSPFPWFYVIAALIVLVILVFAVKRRKNV